jgi:hypothetical protein
MVASVPGFYKPAIYILRASGIMALVGIAVGAIGHTPEGYRFTAAALSIAFLVLAATFMWGVGSSWRARGPERSLLQMVCGIIGWLLLAVAGFAIAAHGWGQADGKQVSWLVAAALGCLGLCFGPTLVREGRGSQGGSSCGDT